MSCDTPGPDSAGHGGRTDGDASPVEHHDATIFWAAVASYTDRLLRRSIVLMNGNRADAEDALSATFLRAERAFREGLVILNLQAWLHRVLHNVCIDLHREHQRMVRHIDELGAVAVVADPVAASPNPERVVLDNELGDELIAVLDQLPPPHREVVVMRSAIGLPYSEIADRLGISDANARKRMQLGRARLQELFTDPHKELA